MKRFVLVAALVLGSAALYAQTATTTAAPAPLPDEKTLTIADTPGVATTSGPATTGDVTIWDFLKMVLILALVIGMILGFVWFMRRLSGQGKTSDSPIRVLHTQTLGGSRSLQVVDVAGEILLLGTSDAGVSLVKDLSATEAGDAFRLAASREQPVRAASGFGDLLGGFLGVRPKIRPDVGEPVENSSDFLKKQRERLKKL